MTAEYHVFLPPPSLAPFPLPSDITEYSPLHFQDLVAAPRHHTFSQSSLPPRHTRIRPQLSGHRDETPKVFVTEEKQSFEYSTRLDLGEPESQERHSRASTSGEQARDRAVSPDQSRRRSRRLARTTGTSQISTANPKLTSQASLLGTLPQLDNSESSFSLNTTNSNPSQLPPTAEGNDSVSHLPRWHVPLSKLLALQSLVFSRPRSRSRDKQIVTVIVCVMSVDQPVLRQRKEEKARGAVGTLWIGRWEVTSPPMGQEDPVKCDVKLWEGCAREWGDDQVRKGDIVLLENVEFKPGSTKDPAQLILSPTPSHTPRPTILYRTLPRPEGQSEHPYGAKRDQPQRPMQTEDKLLRPDLRLARSDAVVKRVVEYARWFAGWVGGEAPP